MSLLGVGPAGGWRALVVSVVFVAAVALPGVRLLVEREPGDGFPLSTYPMFDEDPGRVLEMPTVVAETGDGVERLSPEVIAGTDQVVQAWEAVRDAAAEGPAGIAELCREVAGRLDGPRRIAVVMERHDIRRWSADPDAEPVERRVLGRCRVHG